MGIYLKTRKDGSKAWYYDFMHNKVRYRGVGGTTKTQALRTQDRIRSQVLSGEYDFKEKPNNPRFEIFVETYLNRRKHLRSASRDKTSTNHLLSYFSGKHLMSITASDIEDYIAKRREEGVVNATINRELACIKRMYTLAVKWNEAKKNPAKDVDLLEEPPARNKFLSEEEAQSLINSCYDYFKPIVITALNTGMRLNEILSLTWDRVHIDAVIDPYLEILQTKNNRARYIHLNEDMVNMLDAQKGKHPNFVFIGSHGQPLKSIRKPFLTALRKAGILDFRFHDLRHTFASHFVMRGGDLLTLKEILGHRSMQMVEKYAHLAAAHKRRQINNLNGMFSNCHPIATSGAETKKAL